MLCRLETPLVVVVGMVVLIGGCVAIVYPFSDIVVPPWKVQVVDTSGNPVPNVKIRQVWQNYSTERSGHEEDSITDDAGYAWFPERRERASILQRVLVALVNAPATIHASWGPYSHVDVLAGYDFLSDACVFQGRGQPPSRVILRRRSEISPFSVD